MRRILAVATLLLACARAPAPTARPAAPPPPAVDRGVAYQLSPVLVDGGVVALAVELRLRGDASGVTRLQLPSEWADARDLQRYVRELAVEGATAVREDGPSVRLIDAFADAPLVVRYRVVSAYAEDPKSDDGQPFAPIIRPTWFFAFGEALFAAPEGRDDATASFTWTGAPAGFGFASDLEHLAGARPGVLADVQESIVIGGAHLELHAQADGGADIRVATIGDYAFGDPAFVDLALKVIRTQREFWGDHGAPFLIAMAPLAPVSGHTSLGGTGRSDAFALTVSQDVPLDPLRHLLAHEYFHTWNPRQLGEQQEGAAEMTGKWFAEGFTEFYTWRLLLRAGLYTLEDFVAAWNDTLFAYAVSPARAEPNARISRDYWTDAAVGKLPYQRGPQLAALWERALRRSSAGKVDLDDVLHDMRAAIQAAPGRKLALDAAGLFVPTYHRRGGPDLAADIDRFVERGEPITLPADVFGECIVVRTSVRPRFERGWDPAATRAAGDVVTGLRAGSPAYRAGLRDGMKIVAREAGRADDATIAYVLRVHDGERERRIEFMPRGTGEVTVQQLDIVPGLAPERRAACIRELSGR